MAKSQLMQRIQDFNAGRDPTLLKLKYQKMQANPFAFLRGSCHLFYTDWPADSALNQAPLSWICGDSHLENFGSYKGDNRLTYFDINDFDEAVLAPCTWDVARLLTSIFLAFPKTDRESPEPQSLGEWFLNAYTTTLRTGKARWIERETAIGLVKDLLDDQQTVKRQAFLDKRTTVVDNQRQILIREGKTRAITDATRDQIHTALEQFAAQQDDPEFFHPIDAVWRMAGTSSLGLARYMVLVEGKGSPDRNYVLDLKIAKPSSLQSVLSVLKVAQPQWDSHADRIISIQQRMQAIAPALLHAMTIDRQTYVMREYQPTEDKIELETVGKDPESLEQLMRTLGQLVAWSQLRSSGRQGSAIADALIDFAHQTQWQSEIIDYAQQYSQKVQDDWQEFSNNPPI